jgi:flagellar protein FlaG
MSVDFAMSSMPTAAPASVAISASDQPQQRAAPAPKRSAPAPIVAIDSQIDAFLKAHNQSVRFQVDDASGLTIVNIYNEATGEVVQQIPNEVAVRIAQYLMGKCSGGCSSVDVTA